LSHFVNTTKLVLLRNHKSSKPYLALIYFEKKKRFETFLMSITTVEAYKFTY